MRLSLTAGALALCTTASAFSKTSPFVFLSTAQFVRPSTVMSCELAID